MLTERIQVQIQPRRPEGETCSAPSSVSFLFFPEHLVTICTRLPVLKIDEQLWNSTVGVHIVEAVILHIVEAVLMHIVEAVLLHIVEAVHLGGVECSFELIVTDMGGYLLTWLSLSLSLSLCKRDTPQKALQRKNEDWQQKFRQLVASTQWFFARLVPEATHP